MESSGSFAKPTNERHLARFWARLFQPTPSIPSDLVSISQLCFYLRKCRLTGIIPTVFQTKFCLRSYHFQTCTTHPLILLFTGFITVPHYTDNASYVSRGSGYPFSLSYQTKQCNACSILWTLLCRVIVRPEIGWNKPLNIHDTPLLEVRR
jgi:hypothetical protein